MGRGGAQGQNLPGGAEWTAAVPKQAEYLDFFYHSSGGRLVCMAWRPRPIAMASRRRIVYPWP
jgi:hypothetical protein